MNIIDYSQTAEDHQSLLILVHQIGTQISTKEFHASWERIQRSQCINIPGQRRTVWVRYKRYYPLECNEWGEFQAHRKALGLISVGKCSTQAQFESLFESYKKDKEEYACTLYNSRLIVFGMNTDGSPLSDSESEICRKNSIAQDNENATHIENDNEGTVQDIVDFEGNVVLEENETKDTVIWTHSNSFSKESTGSEVIFFPSISKSPDMDEKVKEFITSIFFVLDGKRLDRSFERADKMQLLCAPFEKKDYIGVDTDAKSYKKKCQGRLRKHLADFCLQAGLPGEAMLHYNTALDILKPVNDWLWMGACYEGLCAASVIVTYPRSQGPSLRRNQSFSVRSTTAVDGKVRTGSIKHSYANGLQDLPESVVRTSLEQDDIIEKYKEALMYYSKYKNAALIEIEASFKACRVLITMKKYLQASDFLQNVIYINLQISDEDRIQRYTTLSSLYSQLGFKRKATFYQRVAAMQCVAPQNPRQNWHQCYTLLLPALEGYRIFLDPKDIPSDNPNGWPILQIRVLHELIFSARRMGNLPMAVRHTTFLLHVLFDHLSPQERQEIATSLENLSSQCEVTTLPLPLESGALVPHVPLTKIPIVKSFKLVSLSPHLVPQKLEAKGDKFDSGVFIFTPLLLGTSPVKDKTKVDFRWMEGDFCEVHLEVYNPMIEELKVTQMGLLTEGVELEVCPASVTIPAESGPQLVKIIARPTSSGNLTIYGYTSQVYGVPSNCKLKDLPLLKHAPYKVEVVPALPDIQLTSTLPKSSSIPSFGKDANVVTTGSAVVFTGQRYLVTRAPVDSTMLTICDDKRLGLESQIILRNEGRLSVERVSVSIEGSSDCRDLVQEVCKWSSENIASQLPLVPGKLISFTLCLEGVGEFLSFKSNSLIRTVDSAGSGTDSLEATSIDAVLKVEYSGGPGQAEGFWRCSSLALSIDILPSLVFCKWDVLPSESPDHVYLIFDVQNISGHQMELQYSEEHETLILEPNRLKRIIIQIERQEFPELPSTESRVSDSLSRSELRRNPQSQYIANFVDIQWTIQSLNVHGKAVIDHLVWTQEQINRMQASPLIWDVRLNGQLYSPLQIGNEEFQVGEIVALHVEINAKASLDGRYSDCLLSFDCTQNCDNGETVRNVCDQVTVIGSPYYAVEEIVSDTSIVHACSFLFLCCGVYTFEIKCQAKGQNSEVHTWNCTSPVKLTIVDEV